MLVTPRWRWGVVLAGDTRDAWLPQVQEIERRRELARRMGGPERIAGRPVYRVTLDLRSARCDPAFAPPGIDRTDWWIDRETFFILKTADFSAAAGPRGTGLGGHARGAGIDERRFR